MESFFLKGFWLLGSFALVYLVGVFTAQWAKDKIFGVPGDLRAALKVMEAGAIKELNAARAKLVADTVGLLNRGKAAVAAQVAAPVVIVAAPAAPAAPVAAAPAAPASVQ